LLPQKMPLLSNPIISIQLTLIQNSTFLLFSKIKFTYSEQKKWF